MLKFKDFAQEDQTGFVAVSRKTELMKSLLERVNAWLSSERIKMLRVETLCNYCGMVEGNPQTIRVWYEESS